jgi:gliding motility-associated-like protein
MKNVYSLLFVVLFFSTTAFATHNRAGDISIRQTGPLTVEATVTTYTKASSNAADRDSIEISWGDGKVFKIVRINGTQKGGVGQGEFLGNDIKKNIYISTHTYPGLAPFYVISVKDPNRNGGILNVAGGTASESIPFYVSTTYSFLSQQFQGFNSTPILLQPPIDFGCVGQVFTFNPNAYDVDGDSLAYAFTIPKQEKGINVPDYRFPNEIVKGTNNNISLDARSGTFIWNSPQKAGEYNVAFLIIEYRNGIAIDTVVRDMQIRIEDNCKNRPPTLKTIDEICVIAGDTINFEVAANDPDTLQKVTLTALGGPFQQAQPASFLVQKGFQKPILKGTFNWVTHCEDISDQFYTVIFKAVDNFKFDTTGLATLKSVRIKIVGPPPQGVQAATTSGKVTLKWDSPYACETAPNDYFYGFSVWRRENSNKFKLDTCAPGLQGKGYIKIAFKQKTLVNGKYTYEDTDVERGKTYCYRILGEFAKRSVAGNPYNLVEGLASNEVCVQLSRDLPLITNVSVMATDKVTGQIEVRWSKPKGKDLDTLLNKPPYRYQVLRSEAGGTFVELPNASFTQPSFALANDTIFLDTDLNTLEKQYTYKVGFYINNEPKPLGYTKTATSVFLSIAPTDLENDLSWVMTVPWQNYRFVIYRKNETTGVFDSIGTSTQPSYKDMGLTNGKKYCYYVKSIATYGIGNLINPIFNNSQEVCAVPIDNVPPCAPKLEVKNICDEAGATTPAEDFINMVSWTNPNVSCTGKRDVNEYRLYYAANPTGTFTLLNTLAGATSTTFMHQPDIGIAGCYAVEAIDSVGNISPKSNVVCVDNCPLYTLSNAFTPNDDTQNDVFKPFPYRFIAKIELQIFNRWGALVFETTDPNINWDGKNLRGEALAESTYYYTCKVYEQRVTGVELSAKVLSGFIELVRGK